MTPKTAAPAPVAAAYDLAAIKAEAAARRVARAAAAEADLLARYPHIVRVAARGESGPTRVVILCADPQSRQGVSVCEGEREIAVQDVFQVRRCAACAERAVRIGRREKAKARAKADKAALRALRAERA
jgi:hypothetical protein